MANKKHKSLELTYKLNLPELIFKLSVGNGEVETNSRFPSCTINQFFFLDTLYSNDAFIKQDVFIYLFNFNSIGVFGTLSREYTPLQSKWQRLMIFQMR